MKGYMGKKDLRILEEEDLDDTLSLSDLILVHDDDDIDSEVSEKYYDSKSSVTSSSDDEDHTFEFISNYKNNVVLPPENILFCGKLIPYKNNNPILSSSMSKKRSFSFSRKNKFLGYNQTHEMELKDLKNRLDRKVGDGISDYNKYGKGSGNGKGKGILWSLIKAISCTSGGASYHAQSAVKASIGCMSLV
ncbi:hypothetical protein AABB24_013922 [Solanum stoloniferum]|uniref:Uncharacterized protein n=2 Tax=Solanum TaxID=4107 RepID=A0AAF0U771_SOLVR|nr:hypothetical protein KY284_034412 [Solanum tuberosum]WMV40733.1 hypothetical protein MTR67_034118 [Solanum verrucosum]